MNRLSESSQRSTARARIARRGREPRAAVPVSAIEHTIRHTTVRGLGFVGLLAIALIHLLDVIGKISETPYLGVMYIALMIASVLVAFALLHSGSPRVWAAGGMLAAVTLIGFVVSRTIGLPSATSDIGNWSENLGLASMFIEAAVIAVSVYALVLSRNETLPGVHASLEVAE